MSSVVADAPSANGAAKADLADRTAPDRGDAHDGSKRSAPDLTRVVGLAVALVGVGIGASRLSDNSFLTHLATGRHVVDSGFLRHDIFTWTSNGESVVVQSWLASALYGIVDAAAGFQGIRLLMAVTAGVLAFVCWQLTARSTSVVTRLAIMAPVLVIGLRTWTERPLLLGLVLLGLTLLVAEGRGKPWWLVFVGALWISVHGSWPLGIVLLGARWLGARLDGDDGRRDIDALSYLAAGIVTAGFVNPYGPALLAFPIELLGRQDTLSHVTEWKAPDFQSEWTRAFLLMGLATVVAVGRRLSWRTAVPTLVFLAAALTSRRNIPVATLVLLPVLAAGLPSIGLVDGRHSSEAIRLASRALLVLLVALPLFAVRGPHVAADRYPVAAIDAMEDRGLSPVDTRVVHPDYVGNYLDLRYGAAGASWIDDRFELHDDTLVEDYLVVLAGSAGWQEVLERHDAEAMLWRSDTAIVELVGEVAGWRDIWHADGWTVLCRPSVC